MLRIVDPAGVDRRLRNRPRRRNYRGEGPNYIWHVDGYNKLKPFGFCIHGCIAGYSRRILWLEVGTTKNYPCVPAKYFLDFVHSVRGGPNIVRADNGTENVNMAAIQCFFRRELLMHLQIKRVFCTVLQFQIYGLKLGGVSYDRGELIGG